MIRNSFIFLVLLLGFLFPNVSFAQRVPKVVNLTTNLSVLTPSTITPEVQTLGDASIGDGKGRLWHWDETSTLPINYNFSSTNAQVIYWVNNPVGIGRWISDGRGNGSGGGIDYSSSINTLSNRVTSVENNLNTVSNTVNDTVSSINTINLSIGSLSATDAVLAGHLTTVSNNVNILSTNINTLSTGLTTVSNTVNSHTVSISALQSNLTTVSNSVNTANSNITTISNSLNVANNNISNLGITTSANSANISSLQSNLTTVSNNVNTVSANLTTVSNTVNSHTSSISTLQSNLTTVSNSTAANATAIAGKVSASPWGTAGQISLLAGTNGLIGWQTPAELTNTINQIVANITGIGGVSVITQYVPTDYYDSSDGTVNTNDVGVKTKSIQDAINQASSDYNTNTGARVTLVFQPGSIHIDQLTLMPNVIYKAAGEITLYRATDYSATTNRGILATRRVDGIDLHYQTNVNSFKNWKTNTVDYSDPDNWYGLSDNIRFAGPGKFIIKYEDKRILQPPVYLNEVRNFFVESGAIEVWHGTTNNDQWGIAIGGRNIYWDYPIVLNGYGRGHDGVHVLNGRNMIFTGGYIQSGDDSVAIGRLCNGVSNIGPDEPIEDVTFLGPIVESQRGRGFFVQVGLDNMNVPWTEGNKVRRITCVGMSGKAGIYRQAGVYIGDFAQRDKIYSYSVASGGTGYTNGYFVCPVTGGGGSGAECVVWVSGGSIQGAWPKYVTGSTWVVGSGYSTNGTVDLSGLAGSPGGGSVIAKFQPYQNDLLEDIYLQGNLEIGSTTHDTTQPYGLMLEGCRRVNIDMNIFATQSTAAPQHRPVSILSAEDCTITLRLSGAWNKSGLINPGQWLGSVVDRVRFNNGSYVGTLESGSAVFKLTGNMGNIEFNNNTFNNITNNGRGIYTFDSETTNSPYTYITNLTIRGNVFSTVLPAPASSYGFMLINTTNTSAIGTLVMTGNDFSRISSFPSVTDLNSDVDHWFIRDNIGYKTRNRQTATIAAGSTSQVVTIGTATGFPDTSDEGIGCIKATPVSDWGSATKWWITPTSATTYTLHVNTAPGGSGLKYSLDEDTTVKE